MIFAIPRPEAWHDTGLLHGDMRSSFIAVILSLVFFGTSRQAVAQGSFGYGANFGFGTETTFFRRAAPPAQYDPRFDFSLVRAARIAEQRASRHSSLRCWHFVKAALMEAGAVRNNPTTAYARQAGAELVSKYGFVQLRIRNPYRAPIGAVLVYGGYGGAGHVELRTAHGFASDYASSWACRGPLIGVYAKLSS